MKWIIGAVLVAIPTVLLFLHLTYARPFGFASKNKNKKDSYSMMPSESDISGLIKQHHIGDPNKDLYDIETPSSGKHKGDIEITDLSRPYSSSPKKKHYSSSNIIYPYNPSMSENDCCAILQQMTQGRGYYYDYDDD